MEYVEVRLMDLDPFETMGINAQTMRFLDVFLLHCLLSDSPPDSPAEIRRQAHNQHNVAERGREPGLLLERGDASVTLKDWGLELVAQLVPIGAGAGCRPRQCRLQRGSAVGHARPAAP